jgi:hypothetical protein
MRYKKVGDSMATSAPCEDRNPGTDGTEKRDLELGLFRGFGEYGKLPPLQGVTKN